jgi:sugar phosphate isomerase/epimerase
MRISYCTWGMRNVDIEEALPAVAQIGYQGIELAVTPAYPTDLDTLDAVRRRRIAALLDSTA